MHGGAHTIDRLALRQVIVVLAGEQGIAISSHDALDVAIDGLEGVSDNGSTWRGDIPVFDVVEEALHDVRCRT
jgi:hypothetical protein